MSRWCLGLFASAVSTWCLHRAVFGACPDGVWVFLHLQCLHGVVHRLGMCSVAPKIVLCGCVSVAVLDCFNLIMWLPKVT